MYDFLVGIMHVPFHINGFHMIMFSYVKEHTRCNQQKKQEYSGRNQAASRAPGPEGLQPLSSSATAAVRISHNHPQLAASGCGGRHPADASYRSRAAGVFFCVRPEGGNIRSGTFPVWPGQLWSLHLWTGLPWTGQIWTGWFWTRQLLAAPPLDIPPLPVPPLDVPAPGTVFFLGAAAAGFFPLPVL